MINARRVLWKKEEVTAAKRIKKSHLSQAFKNILAK